MKRKENNLSHFLFFVSFSPPLTLPLLTCAVLPSSKMVSNSWSISVSRNPSNSSHCTLSIGREGTEKKITRHLALNNYIFQEYMHVSKVEHVNIVRSQAHLYGAPSVRDHSI